MFPEWRKRVPGKQSIRDESIANVVNMDPIAAYGPADLGASAEFTHGLLKPDKPMGDPPRKDSEPKNPLISSKRYGYDKGQVKS